MAISSAAGGWWWLAGGRANDTFTLGSGTSMNNGQPRSLLRRGGGHLSRGGIVTDVTCHVSRVQCRLTDGTPGSLAHSPSVSPLKSSTLWTTRGGNKKYLLILITYTQSLGPRHVCNV